MAWLGLICRLGAGGTFVFASLDKLAHPQAFAEVIANYHMVPYPLLHPMAHGLPVLEMLLGAALILGVWRRGAALLTGLLTLVFIAAIATALVRGLDISCGCFNTDGGHKVGLELLLRDLVLLAACLPPLLMAKTGPEISSLLRK